MKTILRREFLDHIQSLQFAVLLVLTVILFAANGLIFVESNGRRIEAYRKQIVRSGGEMSTRNVGLSRKPNPLLFIADGGESERPARYTLHPKGAFTADQPDPRTFKLPAVPPLDWSFIIGTLFSLYAILLGYSALAGEKEDGTLRLVLSNPIGRVRLLMGKFLSILSVAASPLLAGTLISLIIIGVAAPQTLALSNLSRIILVLFIALVYISLFVLLSLLASALIHRSSLVLLALLAGWVLFSVIVPSSSTILMEKLSAGTREIQAARMLQPTIQKEIWARIEDIGKRANRGEFKSEEEIKAATDRAFEDGQAKLNQFNEEFERAQQQRLRTTRNLSRLSPTALFQYAAEDLVQSGDAGEDRFLRQLREYSHIYDAYILEKLGHVVQASNFTFSTDITFQGKEILVQSPEPQEYQGDKSDFPKFAERRPPVGEGLKNALGDLAGLLLWNIVLAGLAISAFVRMDVR
jgi:ABC-type transport system involved in multi-copper enzyme maturation permease subunit